MRAQEHKLVYTGRIEGQPHACPSTGEMLHGMIRSADMAHDAAVSPQPARLVRGEGRDVSG